MSVIKAVHEETYSDGRTIGILVDYEPQDYGELKKIESYTYLFRETDGKGMYIFFETIIDLNDYLLYGSKKVKRAYMTEEFFDSLYDNYIDGTFGENLKWAE